MRACSEGTGISALPARERSCYQARMSEDDPQAELRAIGARARKKAIRRALVLAPSGW